MSTEEERWYRTLDEEMAGTVEQSTQGENLCQTQ